MKSQNFELLRRRWPELASLGGFAESYAYADATSSLVKLRSFAENLTQDIYAALALPKPIRPSFIDLLNDSAFCSVVPKVVRDKLHALRMQGNKAAHGETAKPQTALWLLTEAHDLARWLTAYFEKTDPKTIPPFKDPTPPDPTASTGELERLKR